MSKKLVAILVGFWAAVLLFFDVVLYADSIPGNSITQIIIAISEEYSIVPATGGLIMGFLFAHFWDTKSQGK